MRQVSAQRNYVLLHENGAIHYPFSKFLTDCYENPHTRELVAQSLRVFYRFCNAHKIELLYRAIEGRCLTYNEAKSLAELCFRPMSEIESMADKKVVFLTSPKATKLPKELPNSVEPNTARKRLNDISHYLNFYLEIFLEPNIRSNALLEQLRYEYNKITHQLRKAVRGTKQNHHLAIQSIPIDKYLKIIEAVFVRPEKLFQSERGKESRTLMRDRAMTLLSCEGLRPGTLGNIVLSDFQPKSGHLIIKDNRAKRAERITTGTPKLKMGNSTKVTNASETMITLWPFTVLAIQDYIDTERSEVLMKRLVNRSAGFLFLNEDGEPIKHRSSITEMFKKLGRHLASQGLLDIDNDPYFHNKKRYDFYSYVLRHSAASFFLAQKCTELAQERGAHRPSQFAEVPDRVKDLMKLRFGWTMNSNMPEVYAARALSDNARVELTEFHQGLLEEVQKHRKKMELT